MSWRRMYSFYLNFFPDISFFYFTIYEKQVNGNCTLPSSFSLHFACRLLTYAKHFLHDKLRSPLICCRHANAAMGSFFGCTTTKILTNDSLTNAINATIEAGITFTWMNEKDMNSCLLILNTMRKKHLHIIILLQQL